MSSSENKIPALPATLFCGHCDPRLPHLISAFDVLAPIADQFRSDEGMLQ